VLRESPAGRTDRIPKFVVGNFDIDSGHTGVRGNEIAVKLARDGSVRKFVGPEPSLGFSRQNIRRKIRRWLDNQQWARWRGLGSTQRRDRELISGPSLSAKIRLSFFNRTKSRIVIGLLNGHNTLRRHLHFMGLIVLYVGGVE